MLLPEFLMPPSQAPCSKTAAVPVVMPPKGLPPRPPGATTLQALLPAMVMSSPRARPSSTPTIFRVTTALHLSGSGGTTIAVLTPGAVMLPLPVPRTTGSASLHVMPVVLVPGLSMATAGATSGRMMPNLALLSPPRHLPRMAGAA